MYTGRKHVETWFQDVVQPVSRMIRYQIYAVHKKKSKIKVSETNAREILDLSDLNSQFY